MFCFFRVSDVMACRGWLVYSIWFAVSAARAAVAVTSHWPGLAGAGRSCGGPLRSAGRSFLAAWLARISGAVMIFLISQVLRDGSPMEI